MSPQCTTHIPPPPPWTNVGAGLAYVADLACAARPPGALTQRDIAQYSTDFSPIFDDHARSLWRPKKDILFRLSLGVETNTWSMAAMQITLEFRICSDQCSWTSTTHTSSSCRAESLKYSTWNHLRYNIPSFFLVRPSAVECQLTKSKILQILSMIEEAAGTRLYESKKESAQKTIEKKDAKLKEIDTVGQHKITKLLMQSIVALSNRCE